jgi:hypothetical protein
MKHATPTAGTALKGLALVLAVSLLSLGCPTVPTDPTQTDYDRGFDEGFALDDWYWDGYDDGYDTLGFGPILYYGASIPYYESPPYDAGYYDGMWYAYNDGYFVDYHYAFILGFSEGYDNAYWPDYLDFLADDGHPEYLNGGWGDGYNDGFSEGKIFGANDYEQFIPFDWEDALADYESGTDLYFEEVDLGTGVYGPVVLYEYGTDPNTLKSLLRPDAQIRGGSRSIRGKSLAKDVDLEGRELFRALPGSVESDLSVTPGTSQRNSRTMRLTTTWLQRLDEYFASKKSAGDQERARRAPAE